MSKNCRTFEELLNRCIDGELSKSDKIDFDKMIRGDAELRNMLKSYRKILKSLKAFGKVEFPPQRLRQARTAVLQRVAALS